MEAGLEVASFDINFTSLLTCTAYEVLLVKGGGGGREHMSLAEFQIRSLFLCFYKE